MLIIGGTPHADYQRCSVNCSAILSDIADVTTTVVRYPGALQRTHD
ncbi:hypothetical protein AAFN90_03445 [Erwiniaceae bacterium CAU 1747]